MFGLGESTIIVGFSAYILYRFAGIYIVSSSLLIGLIGLIYIWYRASTVWQRLGVPSPPGRLFLGHFDEYTKKGSHMCDVEWSRKYGKIFGAYLYMYPEIVISDTELLKKILVKDFHNFTNRRPSALPKKILISRMLTNLKDDDWRKTRNIITPAFTVSKLKETVAIMQNSLNTLCSILDEQTDYENGVDVKSIMGNLSMDIIAATAFSIDIDAQRNPENEFFKQTSELANIKFTDWRVVLSTIFPWVAKMLAEHFDYQIYIPNLEHLFVEQWTGVINSRRQYPKIQKDVLQLLINAVDTADMESDAVSCNGTKPTKKWRLTDRDIVAQALNTVAGHLPVSSTLTMACYLLAWHPDVQKKCVDELKGLIKDDEPITYSHTQQGMPYLEAVIAETMRLYPSNARLDRVSLDDYQLTDQITIPKYTVVVVPVYAIHHDPENYEDPERFYPERFLYEEKKNTNPLTYLPFGYGPRGCIGMRFSQLEMKLVLANILCNFRIEPCSKTEPMPLDLDVTLSVQAKNPIRLNFKRH